VLSQWILWVLLQKSKHGKLLHMASATWTDLFSSLSETAAQGDAGALRERLWQSAPDIRSYLLSFFSGLKMLRKL
jgi:hypothetical protein